MQLLFIKALAPTAPSSQTVSLEFLLSPIPLQGARWEVCLQCRESLSWELKAPRGRKQMTQLTRFNPRNLIKVMCVVCSLTSANHTSDLIYSPGKMQIALKLQPELSINYGLSTTPRTNR